MFENDEKKFNIGGMREKVKDARKGEKSQSVEKLLRKNFSWQAISEITNTEPVRPNYSLRSLNTDFNFSGKVLRGGKYAGEKLKNANFSAADLKEVDFRNADLEGRRLFSPLLLTTQR